MSEYTILEWIWIVVATGVAAVTLVAITSVVYVLFFAPEVDE